MKTFSFRIWAVSFLIGLLILGYRLKASDERVLAERQMSTNHLLQGTDLKGSNSGAFTDKYLRMNVFQGEILTREDVSPTPLFYADAAPWFAVPTLSALVRHGIIDVKSKGQICDQADGIASGAEVVALLCTASDDMQRCTALVRLPIAEADKLAPALAAKVAVDKLLFKPSCK
jgi:hypothetical protein